MPGRITLSFFLLPLVAGLFGSSCLSSTPPGLVRYFEPSAGTWTEDSVTATQPLRLSRVSAHGALGERMIWRLSPVEIRFDEEHRWSSDPVELIEEALQYALFVFGPYQVVEDRDAPRLEVYVMAFEGTLIEEPQARVELIVTVRIPDTGKVHTRRFSQTAPLTENDPAQLAQELGNTGRALLADLRAWLDDKLLH